MADWRPQYLLFHDYGVPKVGMDWDNPYHALVYPDGTVRYRNPANPYGQAAPHAYRMNPHSIGLSYAGPVGATPTAPAMRALQAEREKILELFPGLKELTHGQAYQQFGKGSPMQASKFGRGLDEATWMANLPTYSGGQFNTAERAPDGIDMTSRMSLGAGINPLITNPIGRIPTDEETANARRAMDGPNEDNPRLITRARRATPDELSSLRALGVDVDNPGPLMQPATTAALPPGGGTLLPGVTIINPGASEPIMPPAPMPAARPTPPSAAPTGEQWPSMPGPPARPRAPGVAVDLPEHLPFPVGQGGSVGPMMRPNVPQQIMDPTNRGGITPDYGRMTQRAGNRQWAASLGLVSKGSQTPEPSPLVQQGMQANRPMARPQPPAPQPALPPQSGPVNVGSPEIMFAAKSPAATSATTNWANAQTQADPANTVTNQGRPYAMDVARETSTAAPGTYASTGPNDAKWASHGGGTPPAPQRNPLAGNAPPSGWNNAVWMDHTGDGLKPLFWSDATMKQRQQLFKPAPIMGGFNFKGLFK